jgi:Protein of unknown function (DUF2510)
VSSPRPPGWYDEPSGDRTLLRWWDGRSWTSVTRTRSRGEDAPGDDRPVDLIDSGDPGPARPSRRVLVAAGVGVALVALVLLVGLPNGGTRDDDRLADRPTSAPSFTVLPRPEPPTTTPPRTVTGRVTDRSSRLAYDVLPGEWREWDRDTFRGLTASIGYYRITQEDAPNAQTYWANVVSGVVSPAVIRRTDLAGAAGQLVDTLGRGYYPEHRRTGETRRALTVDGAPAYLIRYTAVFDPDASRGYAAKSEAVAVLVVDTGDERPSALYVSLPDTVRGLWPSVESLLASVRIVPR